MSTLASGLQRPLMPYVRRRRRGVYLYLRRKAPWPYLSLAAQVLSAPARFGD
jgi:hypothetical protein